MTQQEVSKEELTQRLKRIEGQVRGIQKMIGEGRDCESIITQLAAIRSAVEGVGAVILNNYTKICFRKEFQPDSENINSLARSIAIWGGVRTGEDG